MKILFTSYLNLNPSIEEELSIFKVINPAKTICVFHSPPFGAGIDTLHDGKPSGSKSIRNFIIKMTFMQ